MRWELDRWLTEALGRRAIRGHWTCPADSPPQVRPEELLAAAGGENAFFWVKCPAEDLLALTSLQSAGFYVVDVNLTFERAVTESDVSVEADSVEIGEPTPADRVALLDLAERCFRISRFHLDPRLPRPLADRVKRCWVESYLNRKRGEPLYVAKVEGQVAGFLAALAVREGPHMTRVLDLTGVDEPFRGRGIGRALACRFMADAVGTFDRLRVGTQLANLAAIRLYEGVGFRLSRSPYVLHAHAAEGKVVP